ncbi:hypothetical protein RHA1_ro08363 (plasmid) [Rhodococcus jostii RHA1]|uniref:Uncharacterized protein n=6 Tax=Nocardiaceae TaxID=85025 RepID=A0A1H4LHF0_9NOCA|nr:hypothetical protein RHA1_ro08363 [Rhodococcus jostii RHA1]EID79566.1 hypothetical protein W59_12901 [Rhodococcus opacus RKJ300 = JCM 13270]PQP20872.1 hypothetical protein C5613_27270 [Rhodococcus opacus]QQZ19143.1 hypothetical protein GO592_37415 [Rhodococcus sp. 21391]SEB70117.1 hypothetical protein SAMN04490239_1289 [Rhodococcus koreensis]
MVAMMTDETLVALKNYEYLILAHGCENVSLVWHTDSVVFGDDGWADIDMLTRPGFTPATECFARRDED